MSPTPKPFSGTEIKLPFGLGKLRLPKWGTWGLTIIFLVVASAWSWTAFIDDALHPDTIDVTYEAAVQYEESMKHIAEKAASEATVDGGALVKYFSSDACIAVFRPLGAGFKPYFLLDPSRSLKDGPKGLMGSLEAMNSGFIPTGNACQGKCLDPHPGVFYEERRPLDLCVIDIYREWEGGCSHLQAYNTCANVWGPVRWICCVH